MITFRIIIKSAMMMASVFLASVSAHSIAEVSFGGGKSFAHGALKPEQSRLSNNGWNIVAGVDQFVQPVLSLGFRISYSSLNYTTYSEVSGRLALTPLPQDKFGPFFYASLGVHDVDTYRSSLSEGYGLGIGLRIPMGKSKRTRLLIDSTYNLTRDARMLSLRFLLAFGSRKSSGSDEF